MTVGGLEPLVRSPFRTFIAADRNGELRCRRRRRRRGEELAKAYGLYFAVVDLRPIAEDADKWQRLDNEPDPVGRGHFRIWPYSLPVGARAMVNSQVRCGAGSFPHVLRGRDVRDSLWETCWTLPRSVGIGAD